MKKAILVIIYNHNYEKNVKRIKSIYKNRFDRIVHLMPFYSGSDPEICAVYDNSHYFQGYIAQAAKHFISDETAHYLFIADDLILNPDINQDNYRSYFEINDDQSYIYEIETLDTVDSRWKRIWDAVKYNPNIQCVEVEKLLPSYDEAQKLIRRHGLIVNPISTWSIYGEWRLPILKVHIKMFLAMIWYWLLRSKNGKVQLKFPMVRGYSDILIIDHKSIQSFVKFCGIFAATEMFVELAIPTALALSAEKIVTDKNLSVKGITFWTAEQKEALEPFGNSLQKLLSEFPKNNTFIHPIKLSHYHD